MYWRWIGTAFVFGLVCLFAVAPVLFVLTGSFDQSQTGQPFEFGLSGWREAFSNPKTSSSIAYSFILSLRIPLAVAIAFPIAWALVRWDVPFSGFIEKALWFGFFLPIIPLAMGWVLLLDESYGLLNQVLQSLSPSIP
jgi:iron(III) transport system permease protein